MARRQEAYQRFGKLVDETNLLGIPDPWGAKVEEAVRQIGHQKWTARQMDDIADLVWAITMGLADAPDGPEYRSRNAVVLHIRTLIESRVYETTEPTS